MPRASRTPRTRSFLAAGLALLVLTACTPEAMPTPTATPRPTVTPSGDGVLRIGTLFPTTGDTSFLGAAQVAGVNAAIREINAAGGVLGAEVEVVNRDSGDAASETAEASFAALVEKGVDVVIGPSSSVLAERLLPLAAEAGIPLISPAASYPWLSEIAEDGWFARTVPSYPHQGVLLGGVLAEAKAAEVVLVTTGDELSATIETPLEDSLVENGSELVATVQAGTSSEVAAAVAEVAAAAPDAVVLASPDNGDLTRSLIAALVEAGYGGSKLWLTSQNLADYSQSLPAGTLTGVNGVLEGVEPDEAFVALLHQEDPGLTATRYAAEAYDATVIAALAAVLSGDDGGASIASRLVAVTRDGIRCSSYGECLDVLQTEPAIAYAGAVGALLLDEAGDPTVASYGVFVYDDENRYSRSGTTTG